LADEADIAAQFNELLGTREIAHIPLWMLPTG
jgi:hypothetical protein